jgi:hypothetical protein
MRLIAHMANLVSRVFLPPREMKDKLGRPDIDIFEVVTLLE